MRIVSSLVFAIAFFAAEGQSFTGDSWEQVKTQHQGTITVAYVATPGFVYKDASGKLRGISVDVMNDFVHYVDSTRKVTLSWKTAGDGIDFKGMYDSVRNGVGGVFGLGSITITDERKKEIKFSPPYVNNFAILITQSNVPMLTRLEDLPNRFANFTAYTPKGTLHDKRVAELKQKYFPNMKVAYTATGVETIEKVTADPNGFAYLDFVFYLQAMQEGKPVRRHPIGDKPAEQYGIAMPLSSDWSPLLEEFFAANGGYRNSAHYKRILAEHLGETGVRLLQAAK